MNIRFENEYATLRQEMLERFERIHDTAKYGTGAFIAFLSYYYTADFDNDLLALVILQLIVALIGLSCLNLYRHIYRIGGYIAVIIEKTRGPRWHRMGRQLGCYKKGKKQDRVTSNLPFPFGTKWGEDPAQLAILLLALMLIGLFTVFSRAPALETLFCSLFTFCLATSSLPRILQNIIFIIAVVLFVCNLFVFYKLFLKMDILRRKNEETWKEYKLCFGTEDFPDKYED